MSWYIVKMVYQIISGEGKHTPQFDEQLRLIEADDAFHGLQKARLLGHQEQENFLNNADKMVIWKFIDITSIEALPEITDGLEIHSAIHEEQDAGQYIKLTCLRAKHLFEKCFNKTIPLN